MQSLIIRLKIPSDLNNYSLINRFKDNLYYIQVKVSGNLGNIKTASEHLFLKDRFIFETFFVLFKRTMHPCL